MSWQLNEWNKRKKHRDERNENRFFSWTDDSAAPLCVLFGVSFFKKTFSFHFLFFFESQFTKFVSLYFKKCRPFFDGQ
jgi:hypothetical protein